MSGVGVSVDRLVPFRIPFVLLFLETLLAGGTDYHQLTHRREIAYSYLNGLEGSAI